MRGSGTWYIEKLNTTASSSDKIVVHKYVATNFLTHCIYNCSGQLKGKLYYLLPFILVTLHKFQFIY